MRKMTKKLAGILALTMAFTCISPATRAKEVKAKFEIDAKNTDNDYVDVKPKKLYTLGVGEEGLVLTTNKKKKIAVATSIKISNPKVVSVKSDEARNTIKAKKPGKATVTFKAKDGHKIKVNIKVVPVTMVQTGGIVYPSKKGFSDDKVYLYGGKVTKWTSSNPEILKVVPRGNYAKLIANYFADSYNPFKIHMVKVTAKVGKKTYSKDIIVGYGVYPSGHPENPYYATEGGKAMSDKRFKHLRELYNVSDEEAAAYYKEQKRLNDVLYH